MTQESKVPIQQSLVENFLKLDTDTEGLVLEKYVQILTKNGNEPIPYPDNSTATVVDKLIALGFLTLSEAGVQLSEEWLKESGTKTS